MNQSNKGTNMFKAAKIIKLSKMKHLRSNEAKFAAIKI